MSKKFNFSSIGTNSIYSNYQTYSNQSINNYSNKTNRNNNNNNTNKYDMLYNKILEQKEFEKEENDKINNKILETISNQNMLLEKMKENLKQELEGPYYLQNKIKLLKKAIKYRSKLEKRDRKKRIEKLIDFLINLSLIDPTVLENHQILNLLKLAKQQLKDFEKKEKTKKKEDVYEDVVEEVKDENGEVKEVIKKKRKESKNDIQLPNELLNLKNEILNLRKQEKRDDGKFIVPEGMLWFDKKLYEKTLEDIKNNTKLLLEQEFEEKYKKLEADRIKKEESDKMKKERIKYLLRKFKGYVWNRMTPIFIFKATKIQKNRLRIQEIKKYSETLPVIRNSCLLTLKNILLKCSKKLWFGKTSLNVITNQEKLLIYKEKIPTNNLIEQRSNEIEVICKEIITTLIDSCTRQILGSPLLKFISKLATDDTFLPQSFHFQFEIDRLDFTTFGSLAKNDDNTLKIMGVFFLIFHQLLPNILTKPWDFDTSIEQTNVLRLNLRIIASIFFHFFMDILVKIKKDNKNSQEHLSVDKRTTVRSDLYKFDNKYQAKDEEKKKFSTTNIFEDCFSKEDLKQIFINKVAKFESIKTKIDNYVSTLFIILKEVKKETVQEAKLKEETKRIQKLSELVKYLKKIKIIPKDEYYDYEEDYKPEKEISEKLLSEHFRRSEDLISLNKLDEIKEK